MRFSEESLLRPSNPYAASKASADLLALSYNRTYGLQVTISRSCNNYGPYQHSEKLIPLVILNSLAEKSIPVYGTGANLRTWLYVQDHCEAIALIVHKGAAGQIYNIGGNEEKANLEVVKKILAEFGKLESLIHFVKDREGHDRRYGMDGRKITSELGWHPYTK